MLTEPVIAESKVQVDIMYRSTLTWDDIFGKHLFERHNRFLDNAR